MGALLRATVSIVKQGEPLLSEHVFDRSPVIVSRADPSSHAGPRVLPVPLRMVSKKHAEIHFDDSGITWKDANSANGMVLGGRNVRGAGPVNVRDDETLTLEGDGAELRITLRRTPDAALPSTALTLIDELPPIMPQPVAAPEIADPAVWHIARLLRLNCRALLRLRDVHRKRLPHLGFTALVTDSVLYHEKLIDPSATEDWLLDHSEAVAFEALDRVYWDLAMDCAAMPDAAIRAAVVLMRDGTFAGRLAARLSRIPLLGWAGALVRRLFCLSDIEVESAFLTSLRRKYDEQRQMRPYRGGAAIAPDPAMTFSRIP